MHFIIIIIYLDQATWPITYTRTHTKYM